MPLRIREDDALLERSKVEFLLLKFHVGECAEKFKVGSKQASRFPCNFSLLKMVFKKSWDAGRGAKPKRPGWPFLWRCGVCTQWGEAPHEVGTGREDSLPPKTTIQSTL